MKKLLHNLLYIFIIFIGVVIPYPAIILAADDIGGVASNFRIDTEVTYSNPITITFSNIQPNQRYAIDVLGATLTCASIAPVYSARVVFGADENGNCRVAVDDPLFMNFQDTKCEAGTFSGKVDTEGIIGLIDGQNVVHACLTDISDNSTTTEPIDKSVVVTKGTGGSADHRMVDAFNMNGRTNSSDNPARPGEDVGIHLTGAKSKEYQVFYQQGSPAFTAKCDTDACGSVYFTIPQDFTVGNISVILNGDKDSYFEPLSIWISTTEPLPTPTPLPPPPPCAVDLTTNDNDGCTSIWSGVGQLSTDPAGFLVQLFSILLSMSGGIALLLIIRSGYQIMTSQGNAEKVKEARERLTSVFVGLLFLILSLVILQVIGVDLLNLPGLSK